MGWKQIGLLVAGCVVWPGVLHAADCADQSRRTADAREALQRCQALKRDCAMERGWLDGARSAERDCRAQARRTERERHAPAKTQARMLAPVPSKKPAAPTQERVPSGRQR
jgi:hypothetical protein